MKTSFACCAILLGSSYAACPNGCSNHGVCGENDSCTCHANWIGADCSQRQCMAYKSWMTTGQGDLNYDGDREDATIHQADTEFTKTSLPYVVTQSSPRGDWEYWPSKFSDTGEAHFYMECSNRGTCNRETGECECFAGYTGEACRRTECPDDCNGRGLCLTVGQQGDANGNAYKLWDHDMSRSCQCDPGFTGPSCAEIECPAGDDPLTVNQQHATQFVDIYIEDPSNGLDGDAFTGSITVTFEDKLGETWTTADVNVAPFTAEASPTGAAAALQAALRALPESLLEDVTVTEGFCGAVIPGDGEITAGAWTASDTGPGASSFTPSAGDAIHCPTAVDTTNGLAVFVFDTVVTDALLQADGSAVVNDPADQADITCEKLTKASCLRLKVQFSGTNTGAIPLLVANTDKIKVGSESDNNELNTFTAQATFVTTLPISVAGETTIDYVPKSTVTFQESTTAEIAHATAAKTIAFGTDHNQPFGSSAFERIQVTCGNTLFGTYTVDSVDLQNIVVKESIPDCASGLNIKVDLVTDYLKVNADLTAILPVNSRVSYSKAGTMKTISNAVLSVHYATPSASSDGFSYVYLDNNEMTTDDMDFATSSDSAVVDANTYFYIDGTGTSENSPCSSRGVCDSEKGECMCFKGYTGYACNAQNNLAI